MIVRQASKPTAQQVSDQIPVVFEQNDVISRETFIDLHDARWKFNGVGQIQELYTEKRMEAIHQGQEDFDLYREYVNIFSEELEPRLE